MLLAHGCESAIVREIEIGVAPRKSPHGGKRKNQEGKGNVAVSTPLTL